jgi:hypothetical protein
MATITLDYDGRNSQAQKALDFILSLGIFSTSNNSAQKKESLLKKREELDRELDKYPIDLSNYKFNRDEANDYE